MAVFMHEVEDFRLFNFDREPFLVNVYTLRNRRQRTPASPVVAHRGVVNEVWLLEVGLVFAHSCKVDRLVHSVLFLSGAVKFRLLLQVFLGFLG